MDIESVISIRCLNYTDSPYYLSGERLYEYPGYSHIFRLASEKCDLHGVYTLKTPERNHPSHEAIIPVVYVCEADTEQQAREFHRLVWNQNIVPFLIVLTPKTIRLYPGFNFDPRLSKDKDQSIFEVAKKTSEVLKKLSDFTSESINRGDLWTNRAKDIPQNKSVDRRLLRSLKSLSTSLRDHGLPRQSAHALIGKFVYLYYLKDRKILSDRKLKQWAIDKESIFGRNSTLEGFYAVTDRLEDWLNGIVFPVPRKGRSAPKVEHIQKVSSAFLGDDPESGQMHLDFKAYNFEYIPIETLSIVYQQFLHAEGKGRSQGAYYTPIHLVNFVLDELDSKRPFQKGMKALDPACGSGAFLVQCYRRLVEQELAKNPGKRLQPPELKYLMTNHIYGMDVDEDACGVTELSLILTLLDYVDPPDLEKPGYKKFKLPALRNQNIFCCKDGFFRPNSECEKNKNKPENGFDWIVGNPPWKNINTKKLEKGDESALDWIKKNKDQFPTSDNQIAEAFDMTELSECGRIFAFPKDALKPIKASRAYVRKGRGVIPLKICRPPHIIVDQARRFAVFSNDFIVVPPRQIGIAGSTENVELLKALSIYLSSDFAFYHQFLSSSFWGIERDISHKNDLENLPIPLDDLSSYELSEWVSLHDELVRTTSSESQLTLFNTRKEMIDVLPLLEQLNERVYALMGINQSERWLIQDLLHVRKNLNEGRIDREAIMPADETEMLAYANVLKKELDSFLDDDIKDQHRITVFYSNDLAMAEIEHPRKPPAGQVSIVRVEDHDTKKEFKRIKNSLLREQGQWIYFNRNLKLFEGRTTYFAKPLQRLSWLKSQALIDADEFIAEKLTMTGDNN